MKGSMGSSPPTLIPMQIRGLPLMATNEPPYMAQSEISGEQSCMLKAIVLKFEDVGDPFSMPRISQSWTMKGPVPLRDRAMEFPEPGPDITGALMAMPSRHPDAHSR